MKKQIKQSMIFGKKIIRSLTNDGQPAKQIFILYGSSLNDLCLIIKKYTLTDLPNYDKFQIVVKTFKGKKLYFSWFSIRINTLNKVLDWLRTLNDEQR
jgi:hypothetical protein